MGMRYMYRMYQYWIRHLSHWVSPYNSDAYRPVAAHLVDRLYGFAGGTRLMGSAAAELCYVAAGRFDARIEAIFRSLGRSCWCLDFIAGRRKNIGFQWRRELGFG